MGNCALNTLVLLILILLSGIHAGLAYGLSAYAELWTSVAAAAVLKLGVLWCLLRYVARVFVFPGSLTCCVSMRELEYDRRFSVEIECTMVQLCRFLALLRQNTQGKPPEMQQVDTESGTVQGQGDDQQQEPGDGEDQPKDRERSLRDFGFSLARCRIALPQLWMLKRNFATQVEDGCGLTEEQTRLAGLASTAATLIEHLTVSRAGLIVPIAAVLEEKNPNLLDCTLASTADSEAVGYLLDQSRDKRRKGLLPDIISMLADAARIGESRCCSPRACLKCLRRRKTKALLGTLGFLRAELRCRFDGVPFRITTPGGCCDSLDAMLIPRPGLARKGRASGGMPTTSADRPEPQAEIDFSDETVMILIGGNAGYMESSAACSDMLRTYLQLGFSVLLFNYRGYGRSTGSPSTWRVAKDGEAVVNHLKTSFGVRKFAVHGRSIGGFVACHIARKYEEVGLLIADRTFSSLIKTGTSRVGFLAAFGLPYAWYFASNVKNYMSRPDLYKVTICDPKDQVVCDAMSLRSKVAARTLKAVTPAGEKAVVPEHVLGAFLSAWESMVSLALAVGPSGMLKQQAGVTELDAENVLAVGDYVRWLYSDADLPVGTLGMIGALMGEEEGGGGGAEGENVAPPADQVMRIVCSGGQRYFLKAEELVRVSGLELLILQCLRTVGDLDAAGCTLSEALNKQLLTRDSLTQRRSMLSWIANLSVWGSRSLRSKRAVLAWKARCKAHRNRTAGAITDEVATEDAEAEAGELGVARRHFDVDRVYCPECGMGLKSNEDLEEHLDKLCGQMPIQPETFAVGDRVECQDRGGVWHPGTVTTPWPVKVKRDGIDLSMEYESVRPLLSGPLSSTDIHRFGMEQAAADLERASVQLRRHEFELAELLAKQMCDDVRARAAQACLVAFQDLLRQLLRHYARAPGSIIDTQRSGHLVRCNCGHNGDVQGFALEQVAMHVRESRVLASTSAWAPGNLRETLSQGGQGEDDEEDAFGAGEGTAEASAVPGSNTHNL